MYPFLGLAISQESTCPLFLGPSISSTAFSPNPSSSLQVGVRVSRNGNLETIPNGVPNNWVVLNPTVSWIQDTCKTDDIGVLYEVRFSGSGSGFGIGNSAVDTWLPITQTRLWTYGRTGPGNANWTGTLEVRRINDPSNIVSADVTLSITIIDPV